jgi:hypothetical protein
MKSAPLNRYQALVKDIFTRRYVKNATEVLFSRDDLILAAKKLNIAVPKNIGDVVYSFRYRYPLPPSILATQPAGKEWIIEGRGKAEYALCLVTINRITPNTNLVTTKIPDSTPEIIARYALSDEQALLAIVRYNRLIDIFLGITSYSLQNHLRTTVKNLGQIEIDELYAGVDRYGRQFIIPVQAKSGKDQLSTVQAKQDLACCKEKFPDMICRAISAQFLGNNRIAMFELCEDDEGFVRTVDERHYQLVPGDAITSQDLDGYKRHSS